MSQARVTCVSGVGVKGPACFILEAEEKRILIDFGQGPDNDALPDVGRIGSVDALVLSHGHRDHTGAMGLIDAIGNPPVFCTEWLHRDLSGIRRGGILPAKGVGNVLGIPVQTGRTGHAPGGVWLRFSIGDGFLYTGDVYPASMLYPYDPPPESGTAIVDASYGLNDPDPKDGPESLLTLVRAGPCLLPAPADGRGPEMAVFLHAAGLPVVVDEPTRAMAERLCREGTYVVKEARDSLRDLAIHKLAFMRDPIVTGAAIASPATGNSGAVGELFERWRQENIRFVLSGHVAAGSRAQDLLDAGRTESVKWCVHPTYSQFRALLFSVKARKIIPAFLASPKHEALRMIHGICLDEGPIPIL